MRVLRALAPGKVNLALLLGPTRSDGRHVLITVLESLSLADELTLVTDADIARDEVHCPGVEGENLVAAALHALRERGWDAPAVRIEIVKRVPLAAGMGGGSADAAATLRLAQAIAPGRPEEISEIAAVLGADVPSQLAPGLTLATGAGEMVAPLAPLATHVWVIVPQPATLATAEVYREADRLRLPRSEPDLRTRGRALESALVPETRLDGGLLVNDLEAAALSLHPPIGAALAALRRAEVDHAMLCGSGPTVAGLLWGEQALHRARAVVEALTAGGHAPVIAQPVTAAFGVPQPVSAP